MEEDKDKGEDEEYNDNDESDDENEDMDDAEEEGELTDEDYDPDIKDDILRPASTRSKIVVNLDEPDQ